MLEAYVFIALGIFTLAVFFAIGAAIHSAVTTYKNRKYWY